MSLTTGPFTIATGATLRLDYPSDAAWAFLKIDNVTPYNLVVMIGSNNEWLPPFTSNVFRLSGTHQTPTVAAHLPELTGGELVVVDQITATWFLADEPPPLGVYPMAITGPAIEQGLASQGIFGASASLKQANATVAFGAHATVVPAAAGKVYRIWNWGILGFGGTPPSTVGIASLAGAVFSTTDILDSVGATSPSSNRVAGVQVDAISISNGLGGTTASFYVLYSEQTA